MNTLIDQIAEQDRRIRDLEARVAFWRAVAIVLLGLWVILAGSWLMAAPPSPAEAVEIAVQDALSLPHHVARRQHYLLVMKDTPQYLAAASYILNTVVSHSPDAQPMIRIANCDPFLPGKGYVVAIDRDQFAPKPEDAKRFIGIWESLAVRNVYFHDFERISRQTARVRYSDGTTAVLEFLRKNDRGSLICLSNGNEVVFPNTHAELLPLVQNGAKAIRPSHHLVGMDGEGLERYEALCKLTGSSNPIMRWEHFLSMALRARTKDDAGNALLFPGIYYQLRGLQGGVTKFGDYLESRGGSLAVAEKQRSNERAGIGRRRLNESPSSIDWFHTAGVKASLGSGVFYRTRDFRRDKVNAANHPLLNLLDESFEATECFAVRANGGIEFTLFNNAGILQEFAPGDIANDRTVPDGQHQIIEAGHSCLRCHGPHDMYQPFANDVLDLAKSGLDIIGEGEDNPISADQYARLKSLYGGDPDDVLPQSRLTQSKYTTICTAGVFLSDDRASATAKTVGAVCEQFDEYYYSPVTRRRALLELGYPPVETEDEAIAVFRRLLPKLVRKGTSPETLIAHIMRTKVSDRLLPRRYDWEQEYPLLATRFHEAWRNELQKRP